jgi:hypothetical protein
LTVIVAAPLGFILSLLGVILNQDRRAGILGLILIGALAAFVVLPRL